MPTARARHMVTESDHIANALDIASTLWPDAQGERGELLRRIIALGIADVENATSLRMRERADRVAYAAGSMNNVWGDEWRESRDAEWPA
jgi:hypothetical protein